jgi:cobalt/nickel transport system permease protein
MHIADGILPVAWCGAAHAVTYPLIYWSGRKAQPAEIVKMGLLASALFAVSLVHIPVAGTAIHVGLLGLAGILLGARSLVVVFSALLLQALLFQHGGLLALGVNALNMSTGALLAGLLWRVRVGNAAVRGFAAGFAGVAVPAGMVGVEFALAGYGKGFLALAGLYSGVAVLEGVITSVTVGFLARTKPAALKSAFMGEDGGDRSA